MKILILIIAIRGIGWLVIAHWLSEFGKNKQVWFCNIRKWNGTLNCYLYMDNKQISTLVFTSKLAAATTDMLEALEGEEDGNTFKYYITILDFIALIIQQ